MAHRIQPTYRRILPEDLPRVTEIDGDPRPATDAELLNMGIVHVHDDIYSCLEQHQSTGTLDSAGNHVWESVGEPLPGEVISSGFSRERHATLPSEVRAHIMRADVIRSTEPEGDVRADVVATLADVRATVEEFVGPIDSLSDLARATDPSNAEAVLTEARRMADDPTLPAERARIAMADVRNSHVVEAEGLVPHAWHGEPQR